jgi:hypothetical protein
VCSRRRFVGWGGREEGRGGWLRCWCGLEGSPGFGADDLRDRRSHDFEECRFVTCMSGKVVAIASESWIVSFIYGKARRYSEAIMRFV